MGEHCDCKSCDSSNVCWEVPTSITPKRQIKVKKLSENATLPSKKHITDEGWDLYAAEGVIIAPNTVKLVKTDIALEIPAEFWVQIEGRSGMAVKGVQPFGGIIDNLYVGPVGVVLANISSEPYIINKRDRIAQLVVRQSAAPWFEFIETATIADTERGSKGFGSSGK